MKPKPHNIIPSFLRPLFWFLAFLLPIDLYSQNEIDTLINTAIVHDTTYSLVSGLDSVNNNNGQISEIQQLKGNVNQEIDSAFDKPKRDIARSQETIDSLSPHNPIKKILPKNAALDNRINSKKIESVENEIKIDVPKIELDELSKLESKHLGSNKLNGKLSKLPTNFISKVPKREALDSMNWGDAIEKQLAEIARNNINEVSELDKMNALANESRSQIKDIEWDQSKIQSSKNIASVLSENVEAIQTGMESMQDLKSKYSKVNLMNPNGPVLTKISKKPTKPWQFSLNLSTRFQNGLSLQFAPSLGYKLHEKWIGGLGISYQMKIFDLDSSFIFEPQQEFSHRIFNQFNFYKNLFLHLEHELPYKQKYAREEGDWYALTPQKARGWAGVAMQYKIYKDFKGQTQVLYNIIKPNMATENRWTIRINLIF